MKDCKQCKVLEAKLSRQRTGRHKTLVEALISASLLGGIHYCFGLDPLTTAGVACAVTLGWRFRKWH